MPIFWANSDYNRSWTRCLYARFPHAVITKINRHYRDGWIKVWYKNDKRYWKGKLRTNDNKNKDMQYILTEEEYNNLVPKNKVDEQEEIIDKLNDMVLEYSKYHCIHERGGGFGCCDNCPITFSCTKYKHYTK